MKSSFKIISILLAALAAVFTLSSCIATAERPHEYDFDDGDGVSQLPHTRPSNTFDGNPLGGNMPQSR